LIGIYSYSVFDVAHVLKPIWIFY